MTRQQVIEDLKIIRDYFESITNGTVPVCIDEAIRIISEEEETK